MNILNGFVAGTADSSTVQHLPMDGGRERFGAFTKAVCQAVAFTNDMKHIHLHAAGKDFDKTHNLAQDLYDKTSDECDYLAEMALEYAEEVPNFSDAVAVIGYQPSRKTSYTYGEALEEIIARLSAYIVSLQELRNTSGVTDDVQSKLDDMVRDWKVELQYKMSKRSEGQQD